MHRRHAKRNVPIELLRALVTVVDTSSFTKAADLLDLTQSAISAQIARLSRLLGGMIFVKGQGVTLTERGALILEHARQILAENDELLSRVGSTAGRRQLTVGLPPWIGYCQLLQVFQRCRGISSIHQIAFRCDQGERLFADLGAGSIDIAMLHDVSDPPGAVVIRFCEQMVWVKAAGSILETAPAIPLVSWPGSIPDRIAVAALRSCGMPFRIAHAAPDSMARAAAVAAGLGVMAIPERAATSDMDIVREGLPTLSGLNTGIFARSGLNLKMLGPLLRTLTDILAPVREPDRVVALPKTKATPIQRVRRSASRQAGAAPSPSKLKQLDDDVRRAGVVPVE